MRGLQLALVVRPAAIYDAGGKTLVLAPDSHRIDAARCTHGALACLGPTYRVSTLPEPVRLCLPQQRPKRDSVTQERRPYSSCHLFAGVTPQAAISYPVP